MEQLNKSKITLKL